MMPERQAERIHSSDWCGHCHSGPGRDLVGAESGRPHTPPQVLPYKAEGMY